MVAVARKRRARKPAPPPVLGKTTWAILTPTGAVLRQNSYGPGAILALAQQLVAKSENPDELTVERRDLFGAPARLYRVVRDEDGNVDTEIISQED